MDYEKIHWESDFLSTEIYGDDIDDFTVGVYRLIDFPEIILYINTEIGEIIEVFLEEKE